MSGFLGTTVPVFDVAPLYDQIGTPIEKRDMLINNIPLGKGLADKFAAGNEGGGELKHSVVLMRRHGFTCQADSIEKAVYRGIYTKINAKALTDSLAVRKNFEGMGEMAFDGGDLGLTEELTIGSTAMNERFQYVCPSEPGLRRTANISAGTSRGGCGLRKLKEWASMSIAWADA